MTLSIYTAFYNVEAMQFAWRDALENWLTFLRGGQLVLAINTSTDETPRLVREWIAAWQEKNPDSTTKVDIVETAIPYDDPTFDGQIKAAALAGCTEPFAVLLDADERLYPFQYRHWISLTRQFAENPQLDALLIPVVDLLGDEGHYKSVGSKFYLHRNRSDITRGVVKAARRPDGSIDTSVSDTTEPIYKESGELIRAGRLVAAEFPDWMVMGQLESGEIPMVLHLGWMDVEQRLRQAEFWAPVWTARRGGENPEPKLTLEQLESMPRTRHYLPSWKEGRS